MTGPGGGRSRQSEGRFGVTRQDNGWTLTTDEGYVVVDAYHEIAEVLRRQKEFVAQGGRGADATEFVHDTLVDLDGAEHAAQRRLLTKVVSPSLLRGYERSLSEALEGYLAEYRAAGAGQDVVRFDLVELARRTFWHLGARMVGIDDVEEPDRLRRLQEVVIPAGEGVTVLFSRKDHGEVVGSARAAVEAFRREFYLPSRRRRHELLARPDRADELPTDMLTLLLRAHPEPEHDEAVMRQCLVVVGASVSSTVSITCHAMAEHTAWLKAHPEDLPHATSDAFLARVVNETIRLHRTGSPYLIRTATEDAELRTSGRVIRKGTAVALDLRRASRDRAIFGEDADVFDPYRAVHDRRARGYGLGFGSGPHVCLAKRMIVADEANAENSRLLDSILRTLLRAGVRRDPDSPPVAEPHGADRFASFPVVLSPGLAVAR